MNRRPGALLGLAVLLLLLVEVIVLIQIGEAIGAGWTLLLLFVSSVAGFALVKRQGARSHRAVVEAVQAGKEPTRDLANGVLIAFAGLLILVPGFVSDVLGLLLLVPGPRTVVRGFLVAAIARSVVPGPVVQGSTVPPQPQEPSPGPGPGSVVKGEIVEEP